MEIEHQIMQLLGASDQRAERKLVVRSFSLDLPDLISVVTIIHRLSEGKEDVSEKKATTYRIVLSMRLMRPMKRIFCLMTSRLWRFASAALASSFCSACCC